MVRLLLILSSFLSLSYSQSSGLDAEEMIPKQFIPSGSIEALIDDYSGTYYLVQLDLKNDSLFALVNDILPDLELFSGPASYHRIMSIRHFNQIQLVLTEDFFTILNNDYRLINSSR